MTVSATRVGIAVSLFLSFFLTTGSVHGQEIDEIDQDVARVSFVSGAVSYSRGDEPDEWDPAIVNVPFTLGDKMYAPEDGRAELQLPGGNFVRLGPRSYFTALNLTHDTKQFYLGEGSASFNVRNLGSDEVFEIATPNTAVTLDSRGKYRIEVDEDGNSRVIVRRGRVLVAANGRQVSMEEGEMRIYGIDSPRYEVVGVRGPDAFDRWVDERDGRFERAYASTRDYVSDQYIGIEDLRDYGQWEQIPEYGYAWTPHRVPTGWRPYTTGHWFWQDPWGWTFISHEPWGWAPSHYGRWTAHRSRWYWVPDRPTVRRVRYAPACVGFVRVRDGVGWFPLHPRDRHVPSWWRRRVEPQNVTYVNRQYVTVVNQNVFISGRNINNNIVRDSVIVREANSVRVMEHALPVPTRASLRVRGEREVQRWQRPPEKVFSRPAVVRVAPVPPPPTFQEKLPEIQKSRGEPVSPEKALSMGLKELDKGNRRNPIRPASVERSREEFAPRNPSASAPAAQPLTATRGKRLATADAPVLTNLPRRSESSQKSDAQTEQTRTSPTGPTERRPAPAELKRDKPEQARELQKREQQVKERQREEPPPPRKEEPREVLKRRELERQQQEQERQQQQNQLRGDQRDEQQQLRQERLRAEQKRQELERQRLEAQERDKNKQLREQKEQLQAAKDRQREQEELMRQRQQELERQTQLQEQQQVRKEQQLRAAQREEQRRQELQRQQQEKQSLQQQRDAQRAADLERERQRLLQQQQLQQQQLRAAQQLEEQRRQGLQRQQQEQQQQPRGQIRQQQKRQEPEEKVPLKPGVVTP